MDKRLGLAGVLVLVIALFLVAGVIAAEQANMPPAGKSISYYLKWMDASLINGGASTNGTPGGAGGPGAAGDISKLNIISQFSVAKDSKYCIYYITDIADASNNAPVQSDRLELVYSGGTMELGKAGENTYFYGRNSPSDCIKNAGKSKTINPICTIVTTAGLWDNMSGFTIQCSDKPIVQVNTNNTGELFVGTKSIGKINNYVDLKYPSDSACVTKITFNAWTGGGSFFYDAITKNSLYMKAFSGCS